jgi:hypothetical protein
LVGAVGIEPTTFGLKGRCSTTELRPCGFTGLVPEKLHSERLCKIFQLDAFLMEPDHKGMSQVAPVKPNDISIFQRARKPSPSNYEEDFQPSDSNSSKKS